MRKFLEAPVLPNSSATRERIIRAQPEMYHRYFSEFTTQNRINLSDYDAVIGPEMVRGGRQLCVLHKNGRYSTVAEHLRRQLREVPRIATPQISNVPVVSGRDLMMPKSNLRRALGNQAVGTGIAMAVTAVVQSLGERAINQAFARDAEGRLAKPIQKSTRGLTRATRTPCRPSPTEADCLPLAFKQNNRRCADASSVTKEIRRAKSARNLPARV